MILETFTVNVLINVLLVLSSLLTLISLFLLVFTLRTHSQFTQKSFFLILSASACFLLNLMLTIRSIDPFYSREVFLPKQSLFLDSLWSIIFVSWSSSVLQTSYATVHSVRARKRFFYSQLELLFPHITAVILMAFLTIILFLKTEHARICRSILWVSVATLNCVITFFTVRVFLQLIQIVRSNVFTKTKWAATIRRWQNGLVALCLVVFPYTLLTLYKLVGFLQSAASRKDTKMPGYIKINNLAFLSFLLRNLGGFVGLYFGSIREASGEKTHIHGSMSLVNTSGLKGGPVI